MTATAAVRPFRGDDAPALAALFHAAVRAIGARHYSPRQIAAWSPAPGDPARWTARAADGRVTLVAVDARDRPIAYADVERDGHVDHLYCHPDHARTGVAAAVYDAVEQVAVQWGVERLYAEASEPARRFLLRRGFTVNHVRRFELNGVPMHNHAMSKPILPAG